MYAGENVARRGGNERNNNAPPRTHNNVNSITVTSLRRRKLLQA